MLNLLKIVNQLNLLDQDSKLSQFELVSALDDDLNLDLSGIVNLSRSEDGYTIEEELDTPVTVAAFISAMKDMADLNEPFNHAGEAIQFIYGMDFYSLKFTQYGISHGLCDCPQCKDLELDIEEQEFNDEDPEFAAEFASSMINYLSNRFDNDRQGML